KWLVHGYAHDHHSQIRKLQEHKPYFFQRQRVSLASSLSPSPSPSSPERISSGMILVTAYGADPTGKTDSTDAILEAISDAVSIDNDDSLLQGISNLGGVQINLEGGIYKISRPIKLPEAGLGNIVLVKESQKDNGLEIRERLDDLILYHEGPYDVKESKVMDLKWCYNIFKFKEGKSLTQTFTRYKTLMNELVNDGIKLSKLEINTGFTNGLPKKWLSFRQSLRNTNHVKDSELASLFDSHDDEEDTRSSHEYMNDLEEEYQERSLLTKSKRFFKKGTKSASASKTLMVNNISIIAEAYEWDEEEVSSDDNEMVKVKVLMALAEENDTASKEGAKNGKWVKISMRKHVNTEILKENKNLKTELKELTAITKTWLNSSNKVNQCISEQIPSQKKRIMGVDQLTEDPSSSGQKDLVFVKSSTNDTKVSIPGVEIPWLSEAEGFILPNHDTDSADESSVCSTPISPLKKLDGAEPISRPKTIKLILRSKSTFKGQTLKGVIINEPSSALAKDNKSSLASKANSTPAGKALQAKKVEALKSTRVESSNANISKTPTKSGCSRHMTAVKSYLHKYVEQPGPKVVFGDDSTCTTEGYVSIKCSGIFLQRARDVYVLDMTSSAQESCFFAKASENVNWLWHKRLAHLNFKIINKLAKQNFVIGLPLLVYSKDKPCSSCEKEKHHKASFKTKQTSSIKKCLYLLHMDLFGLVTPRSINHEKYTLVIVNEYSRYLWVYFLKKKSQEPKTIISFIKRVKNKKDIKVKQLITDNGTESRNNILVNFCDEKRISQNFSSPYTHEQNGVPERKNRTLIEAARTMLSKSVFSNIYWSEAIATACYTQNRSTIMKRHLKTPYEKLLKRIPNINFLHVFGCPVYIHNHKDHLGIFDEKADDGYLLRYSLVKAFRVFNTRTQQTEETYYITFDEIPDAIKFSKLSVDNINIAENKRYPPDEYLHPY
nr:retrovirus-related Pol polyprotein from transposon TNT 1-94 [Tanacetum cinerariifolium]